MLKRKAEQDAKSNKGSSATDLKKARKEAKQLSRDPSRYINKQRCLVFGTRGLNHRSRHLMEDLRDILPHSKKDVKFDAKSKLAEVNEICEMRNCNSTIFLEGRKRKDLYMWMAKTPNGPSVKFLVQNIHTLAEVKLTGNSLKGSRPLLVFDPAFESAPHWTLIKEMMMQTFGSPKGHPKVKPFVDHVISFFIADNRIWFRNYQIVLEDEDKKAIEPMMVEIGPRFVLNPIRIFQNSFSGATLWENPDYVSPNDLRARQKLLTASKFAARQQSKKARGDYETQVAEEAPKDQLAEVFE